MLQRSEQKKLIWKFFNYSILFQSPPQDGSYLQKLIAPLTEKGQKKTLQDLLSEFSTPVRKAGMKNISKFCLLFLPLSAFLSLLYTMHHFTRFAFYDAFSDPYTGLESCKVFIAKFTQIIIKKRKGKEKHFSEDLSYPVQRYYVNFYFPPRAEVWKFEASRFAGPFFFGRGDKRTEINFFYSSSFTLAQTENMKTRQK